MQVNSKTLKGLRELRAYHYAEVLRNRKAGRDFEANEHLGYVQTLNDFFPVGDTAGNDLRGVVEVRFRAYSAKNPDADVVLRENRLRGCTPGDPCIMWGPSIGIAERRLRELAEQFYQEGITIKNKRVGSFSILCDTEKAREIKAGFLE